MIKVRVQGKSIIGDNIVTSDDENETNDTKQNAKTEPTTVVASTPKIDENQIQNLILTSLKKIVATNETPSPPKKPIAANTGTANKTIARRTIPPRTQVRNAGNNNSNRQQPVGGNARGNIGSLNRNFSGNSNNMLSDFGLNRNLNFGNDIGSNMGNSSGNLRPNNMGDMGGNLSFGLNLRENSSYDNNMMRGGLPNVSDFSSDFSGIGMRRSNMMGNSNSMGSNGRGGFDNNNSGMGMSGPNFNNGNMWGNSNSSNGRGGGGGFNNSWNGNSNRY